MAILKYTIDSILGGQSPITHGTGKGQFLASLGIDPDNTTTNIIKASGHILPTGYTKFSSSVPSGAPMWIMTWPSASTDNNYYVYAQDGELISYNSALASETLVGSPTSGAGNGGVFINDYLALMTPTDVSVYGPLSGAPAFTNTWWTGTAALTALTNTTYQNVRDVIYPNHAGHYHTDGKVYFADFKNNFGMIHKLGITTAGANDGSAYNVLDLPFGVRPYDIESYGTDLAIIGSISRSSTATKEGGSYLFLWDTVADSFYRQINIPTALITSVLNVNGVLYIWGGSTDFGYQLFRYEGGYSVTQIWESREGAPPPAGAVDASGNRVVWGSYATSTPAAGACVMSYGYQAERMGTDIVHSVANIAFLEAGTLPVVSALKFGQQQQNLKRPIVGWRTSTAFGLSKESSTAVKQAYFWGPMIQVNKPFKVREVRLPLTATTDASTIITPTIWLNDKSVTIGLQEINNTNYPSATEVYYKAMEIDSSGTPGTIGKNNFFLQLIFTGASAIGVALPVEITIETIDD